MIVLLTSHICTRAQCVNTLRPIQNNHRFADDTFKRIFLNENIRISIRISLKFVPKVPINNIPALVQIMAWRRPGDKPLSEPMMVNLPTHICVTRPQWINTTMSVIPDRSWPYCFSIQQYFNENWIKFGRWWSDYIKSCIVMVVHC